MITVEYLSDFVDGPALIRSPVYPDDRGWFMETFRSNEMALEFVQGNAAFSRRHVLRGLHYGVIRPQGKLMRTLTGATINVVVDMRAASPSLGHSAYVTLPGTSGTTATSLYVPPGFGNGYLALHDNTLVVYHCTTEYSTGGDRSVSWCDPQIALPWDTIFREYAIDPADLIISEKDRHAPSYAMADKVPSRELHLGHAFRHTRKSP